MSANSPREASAFVREEEAVKSRYEAITFKTRIREDIALAESAGSGKSIFEYDPQSNGAKDYQALTEEIISRNQ